MAKDLTTSAIERQNVQNNNVALPRIQEELEVPSTYRGMRIIYKYDDGFQSPQSSTLNINPLCAHARRSPKGRQYC